MSTRTAPLRQPVWAQLRRRVPGAPADLTLHVLPLDQVRAWAQSATACLSEEELARAHGIEETSARELFVVSRVALRHVLGHRLGCSPRDVPVAHDPLTGAPLEVHGRARTVAGAHGDAGPELGFSPVLGGVRPVRFSVSRAAGIVAVVTAQCEVGVDVERVQSGVETDVLLEILHPVDRTRLLKLRGRRRALEVTRAWVRVGALLKGWGTGLARDPASVNVGPGTRASYGRGWSVGDVRCPARENTRLAVAWRTDPAPQG
ncbi:4'-phosphopantetheinyl transferase family protein [Kocuria varians]|uniref:4'-phosphopantetheinyl transferase family protein n=1 Tax=Kocuria varians TaxID=1272 RepID=UPI00083815EC|nr:phosphopantetheinyl transferase [Kocuria varians]